VANLFDMLNIEKTRPGAKQMSALIVKTVGLPARRRQGVPALQEVQDADAGQCRVGGYEEEGDRIFRGLIRAFRRGRANSDIMKWKEIYETMEDVLDACADVADVMQGVNDEKQLINGITKNPHTKPTKCGMLVIA
jgi:uncharacterized protein Yka (UPF0111/DUF47 family)